MCVLRAVISNDFWEDQSVGIVRARRLRDKRTTAQTWYAMKIMCYSFVVGNSRDAPVNRQQTKTAYDDFLHKYGSSWKPTLPGVNGASSWGRALDHRLGRRLEGP